MPERQHVSVTISTQTMVKVLLIILGIFFLNVIRDVLLLVFIALVLAAALDPSITALERRGIPRGFGIAILYVALLGFLSVVVILFIPLVVTQLDQLSRSLPTLYEKTFSYLLNLQDTSLVNGLKDGLQSIAQSLGNMTSGLFSKIFSFFGGIFAFVGILVMTFYLTLEEKGMKRIAIDLAPVKYRTYLIKLFSRIEERLGMWLRGQLLLGLIIFLLTWAGLTALGVPYALVLALIAGITELVPVVGPIIGAIPAVIVAFSQNPTLGLAVLVLYLVIQQLENHLIVPRVMSATTGLNPVIVIVALLIGAKVAGIVGVILSVPTTLILTTFLDDFLQEKQAEEHRLEPMPPQA